MLDTDTIIQDQQPQVNPLALLNSLTGAKRRLVIALARPERAGRYVRPERVARAVWGPGATTVRTWRRDLWVLMSKTRKGLGYRWNGQPLPERKVSKKPPRCS